MLKDEENLITVKYMFHVREGAACREKTFVTLDEFSQLQLAHFDISALSCIAMNELVINTETPSRE